MTDSAFSSDIEAEMRCSDTITTPTCGVKPLMLQQGNSKLSSSTNSELRSDCESGVDMSSLQISQSTIEENNSTDLSVEKLTTEVTSVAINWKSLRNVHSCSCLTQFEHFTRKVGLAVKIVLFLFFVFAF